MVNTKQRKFEVLFYDTLKDINYAERKMLKSPPEMARAATDENLKNAFEKIGNKPKPIWNGSSNVSIFLGKHAQGKTCDAIEGIIAEEEEIMDEFSDSPALDAGLISSAQAVEHYEITRYGTLKRWADNLGYKDVAKLLNETLQEEGQTDKDLTKLAETSANLHAAA